MVQGTELVRNLIIQVKGEVNPEMKIMHTIISEREALRASKGRGE